MFVRRILKGPKGSYMLVLPKNICDAFGWNYGDKVAVEVVKEDGNIYFVIKKLE